MFFWVTQPGLSFLLELTPGLELREDAASVEKIK